jgi:2-phosphoglycerate kinase
MSAPPGEPRGPVVVRSDYGLPYSKGLMAQSIMATGVAPARSFELARAIEQRLDSLAQAEVGVEDLRQVAEEVLGAEESPATVERFRQWWNLRRLDRPVVVLLGGVTGVGKSTVATQLATRLGITRVIATDQVRQVVRAFFSREFMPAVHYSSFDASLALRDPAPGPSGVVEGFLRQAHDIAPGIDAIVERAVSEHSQVVIEGIHVMPEIPSARLRERAITVQALLAVGDEEAHRERFEARAAQAPRPAARYLEAFDRLRTLQDYLVQQAHDSGIPVIDEARTESALKLIAEVVLDAVGSAAGPERPAAAGKVQPREVE